MEKEVINLILKMSYSDWKTAKNYINIKYEYKTKGLCAFSNVNKLFKLIKHHSYDEWTEIATIIDSLFINAKEKVHIDAKTVDEYLKIGNHFFDKE